MQTTCNILVDSDKLFENLMIEVHIYEDPYPRWYGKISFNRENISSILSMFKPFDVFEIELADGKKGKFKITEIESIGCLIEGQGLLI